ncbi:alpha/beta hydrolase [Phenylobacterium sp.]|uniref:alpha/beta hydrolase n=1 Tax=Phenylobacterium sp. TaxID=1871053 RepID=UPI0025CF59D0|nr:alpha/beta hydrolase [Phenylobacterium sp.]MBX3484709.1 alpha/beta hydrolase [Phenylobacterium sp.]MCW5760158.1 alpha/beta hydrolase [Phenylobacterium sp.]
MDHDAVAKTSRRALSAALGAGFASLWAPAPARAQGLPAPDDPLRVVAPEYAPYFPLIREMAALPPISRENLAERRRPDTRFAAEPAASPSVVERIVPGPAGAPDVRVFVVNGGGTGKPAILHTHGGGFVTGSARSGLRTLQDIARSLGCVIVTVDYRLAPETRFPGALEDNYAALRWVQRNAAELGVDPRRLAVMGESAGGGHAAMLAIAARQRGEVPLVFQALTYPMLDDRTGSTQPTAPHIGRILWRAADNRFGWTSLLGVPAGSARVPPGSVPARVRDLGGLPPAFIAVGAIDLFVDEDIAYARRLIAAGVPTELHVYPGAFHGFNVAPTPMGRRYNAALLAALGNAFATA